MKHLTKEEIWAALVNRSKADDSGSDPVPITETTTRDVEQDDVAIPTSSIEQFSPASSASPDEKEDEYEDFDQEPDHRW